MTRLIALARRRGAPSREVRIKPGTPWFKN